MWTFERSDDDRDIGWGDDSEHGDSQHGDSRHGDSAADGGGVVEDIEWLLEQRPPHHIDPDTS